MTYRERREARAERLRGWAQKRLDAASAALKEGEHYRGDHAFNTQPGHIPERARLIAREDRAFESINKARDMEGRAAGIESQAEHAIYSDDPDAVEKLTARIAGLEAERERIKAHNVAMRKAGTPDRCFPAYHLTNLGGNITRQRARLAALKKQNGRNET